MYVCMHECLYECLYFHFLDSDNFVLGRFIAEKGHVGREVVWMSDSRQSCKQSARSDTEQAQSGHRTGISVACRGHRGGAVPNVKLFGCLGE